MVAQIAAFDELTDWLVAGMAPEKVAGYRVSEKVQHRFDALLELEKGGRISPAEREELDSLLVIHRILYLAKIKVGKLAVAA